jgi:NAD(P)H-nitrite reductase large subunit
MPNKQQGKAMTRYVIIGNGIAGITAAETIRSLDRPSKITVIAAEPYPLYSRPGIGYYLLDRVTEERLFCRPPDFYAGKRIEQVFIPARQIDWMQKRVVVENGMSLPYDKLLIATGANNNWPQIKGIQLQGVVTLSNMDDAYKIKQLLPLARCGVVVGGGITAVELIEIFNHHGLETHYLLRGERFWHRLLTQLESELVENRMRTHGIHLHHRVEITEIIGEQGRVVGVKTNTDQFIRCQMVGIAIGVSPDTDLVEDTLIACDRGILVNERMETCLPDIYAAGDVAQVYDPVMERATLDLLWPSALKEGRAAGINMTGRVAPYQKEIVFNSALLIDVPFTSIGYIDPPNNSQDDTQQISLTRGMSESWLSPHPVHQNDKSFNSHQPGGDQHLRLVMRGDYLIGGVLLGNHTTAHAVRDLITKQIDISSIREALLFNRGQATSNLLIDCWRINKERGLTPSSIRNGYPVNGKGGG